MGQRLELIALENFPQVQPGDDLGQLLIEALASNDLMLQAGDVLVIAQKIVSKAEGRYVRLADVKAGPEAIALAAKAAKDPRQVELILQESREVIRVRPGVIIVEHRNGYVHANAGIDKSNIPNNPDDPQVLLLPLNPDASAEALRERLSENAGISVQIIINDSAGRAWRNGTVGIAIGTAGLDPLRTQIGESDMFGNVLEVTEPAEADELAAAASLVMGQSTQARPVVLARGAELLASEAGSGRLIRDRDLDLFR